MLNDPDKRCGCGRGCKTFGECLRGKNLQIDRHALKGFNELEKRKDATLNRYEQLVRSGLQPKSPLKRDVDACEKTAMGEAVSRGA